jgi:hypothetical protein
MTDSIHFTYRNKSTVWFPVRDIKYGYPFDISLQVNMGDKYNNMLREVIIIKKSYREDSLEFRNKYAKHLIAQLVDSGCQTDQVHYMAAHQDLIPMRSSTCSDSGVTETSGPCRTDF